MTLTSMQITGVPEFDVFFSLVFYMGMIAMVPAVIIQMVKRG